MVLRVSVIIPVLNEQVAVASAISSATAAGAYEVLVVDGGSTDDTVQVASESAVVIAANPGRSIQQNIGAGIATGDVLLFLHADCVLDKGAIKEIQTKLNAQPEIVAGCFRQRIDKPGVAYRCLEQGNYLRAAILKWAYGDQAIFVRADVFESVGRFPPVKFMEDLLVMKLLRKQGKVTVLKSPLVVSARRWERRGIVRQTFRNWCLITAAQLGASPNWLARFYPNDR